GMQGGGEDEADLVLDQEVAGTVPDPGLRTAVAGQLEAEGGAIVDARLLGVTDVELDVVGAVDREGIGDRGDRVGEDLCGHGGGSRKGAWGRDRSQPSAGAPICPIL